MQHRIPITRTSMVSGITRTRNIPATQQALDEWMAGGVPIQNVMPMLSDDDREFIMTGITPSEWDLSLIHI